MSLSLNPSNNCTISDLKYQSWTVKITSDKIHSKALIFHLQMEMLQFIATVNPSQVKRISFFHSTITRHNFLVYEILIYNFCTIMLSRRFCLLKIIFGNPPRHTCMGRWMNWWDRGRAKKKKKRKSRVLLWFKSLFFWKIILRATGKWREMDTTMKFHFITNGRYRKKSDSISSPFYEWIKIKTYFYVCLFEWKTCKIIRE